MPKQKSNPPVEEAKILEETVVQTTDINTRTDVTSSAQTSPQPSSTALYKTEYGMIRRAPIIQEMEKSYLDYAMSVIVSRALPDVRDGLKPVHRRILYAMRQMGIHWNTSYKKSARIVGEVLGKFHPHGDSAVYDALVRLAQDFSMRYQLIDGQGNFGCFTGDTKVRLADGTTKSFLELIDDHNKGVAHFTYTVDQSNAIKLAPINIPRLTQRNAKIVEVELDNGEKIRCTPNHKFMVRDGSYVEAKDLIAGQALMPLYTRVYNGADKNLLGYEETYQPATQTYEFTHRLADAYNLNQNIYQKNKGRVRHHIDFDKSNNDPRNIIRLSWQKHRVIHQQHLAELWKNPSFQAKMKLVLPTLWKQDSFRQKTLTVIRKENQKKWQDPTFVTAQTARLKTLWQLPEFRKKIANAARKKNILLFGTEEQKFFMRTRQHETMVMQWQDPEYRQVQQTQMAEVSKKLWNTTSHREKISAMTKARMSTPEARAIMSAQSKKLWSTSEYWINRSNQSKEQWSQQDYREKLLPVLQKNGVKTAVQRFLTVCVQVIQQGQELTESSYNLERKKIPHNLVPRFSWGVQHFSHGIAEVLERLQQSSSSKIYLNHKVISVHPAGNADVYDLTVDTTHNFALAAGVFVHNSVDGDSAAAMRYTEARLSRISEELLTDIEKETVDFIDTFDGSQQEPTVLPSKLPNLLLMGAEGIAVGMATKIPPHNLNEVSLALLTTIEHGKTGHLPDTKVPDTEEGLQTAKPSILAGTFDSEITIDQLMEHVKGPDFPTGGIMYDWNQIKETYALGKGRVVVRAVASIEEQKNGKFQIIITELPYQVNKSKLVAKIAQLVRDKKIVGISDLRDESDRDGLRVVVDLKKDAKPKAVLNNLYKYTELQSSFSMNMVALNAEGTPQLMNIKIVLTDYIRHRQLVVVRRSQYELKAARDRAHILEGLLIALNHLDEVIETIRKSPDSDTAKQRLMDKFKLSAIQAVAILDMQLRRLAALERQKIEDEYKQIKGIIKDLCTLLSHPQKVLDVIVKEAKEVMEQFGDERRTKLHKGKIGEFSEEDLIANEPAIITVTETGYIKRMSPSVYRPQQRGGVGVTGMTTKEEDAVMMILVANTHDSMLMLTNKGRVFKLKVHELPESGRQAKGTSVVNLINLQAEERLQTILTMNDKEVEEKYIALATKNGLVKKTKLADYQNIRTNGIIAIILKDNDELVWGKITSGKDHIMLITHEGKSIRFPEGEIKVTARDTQGVRAIMLREQDYVVGVEAFPAKIDASDKKTLHQLLLVTQNGMGKRTELSEYPVQKRAGQGVKVAEITKKTGNVTGAMMVEDTTDEVVLTTKSAQVIKLALKNIPVLTRPTQGVILMRFSEKDDQVVAVTTTRATEVGEK